MKSVRLVLKPVHGHPALKVTGIRDAVLVVVDVVDGRGEIAAIIDFDPGASAIHFVVIVLLFLSEILRDFSFRLVEYVISKLIYESKHIEWRLFHTGTLLAKGRTGYRCLMACIHILSGSYIQIFTWD